MSDSLRPHGLAHQAPLSMEILQARTLEWVAICFSRVSSQSRDQTHISCISCSGNRVLYHYCHLENELKQISQSQKQNKLQLPIVDIQYNNNKRCSYWVYSQFISLVWFQPLSTKHSTYRTRCTVPWPAWVLIPGAARKLPDLRTRAGTLCGPRAFTFCNSCVFHNRMSPMIALSHLWLLNLKELK